ncbi:LacI family DNA-binding transcriptional regulator [Collinsella sp. zg1085]|uniref:LacI family DNA-binding transcriptional regulator n=1 Tax=Collinsella sp. zg1085 TaxID=2844380 RepID=UPI001C0DD146|nr:LacI family DNA-binding transcriptional regulator [Collinsella sp. zg1085]QWT18064.1 LacI family DNA-binding transcriptional regulator [Collinsella sp. zg1085]
MKAKVTIEQIATAAGVSSATVSRAINHPELVNSATRTLISTTMQEFKYEPPSTARRQSYGTSKGLIAIEIPWLDNPFYAEIIRGMQVAARSKGYDTCIIWSRLEQEGSDSLYNQLSYLGVSGILVVSPLDAQTLERLKSIAPVVQCCEFNPDSSVPYVSIDDFASAAKATEHLIACGCTSLGILRGPSSFKYARERYRAFKQVLEQNGIEIHPEWIRKIPDNSFGLAYAEACNLFASKHIPEGIFCCSDVFGAAVLGAAHKYHIMVPDDLMIIGFDNVSMSEMVTPPLTTVNQPRYRMGATACSMVIEQIKGKHSSGSVVLDTELIVRETTLARKSTRSE